MFTAIKGELWDYYKKPHTFVLITTNGFVKKDGTAVMGRGCAAEAAKRWPSLPKKLGKRLKRGGNHVYVLMVSGRLMSFPVKHNWWEKADLELIKQSANELADYAKRYLGTGYQFVLPRPGCGNGRLDWSDVKKVLKNLPSNVLVISR